MAKLQIMSLIQKFIYLCDMQPIGNKVIVKPIKTESISKGGLIIIQEESTETGEVLEVSKDITDSPLERGQKVMYSKGAGNKVVIDEEECVILNHHEIWLIL